MTEQGSEVKEKVNFPIINYIGRVNSIICNFLIA